jgi:hypothetical protein
MNSGFNTHYDDLDDPKAVLERLIEQSSGIDVLSWDKDIESIERVIAFLKAIKVSRPVLNTEKGEELYHFVISLLSSKRNVIEHQEKCKVAWRKYSEHGRNEHFFLSEFVDTAVNELKAYVASQAKESRELSLDITQLKDGFVVRIAIAAIGVVLVGGLVTKGCSGNGDSSDGRLNESGEMEY